MTITQQPDWRGALRTDGLTAPAGSYQGETQNFETPGAFFGWLTVLRWVLVNALQGLGELAVRELARRVGATSSACMRICLPWLIRELSSAQKAVGW